MMIFFHPCTIVTHEMQTLIIFVSTFAGKRLQTQHAHRDPLFDPDAVIGFIILPHVLQAMWLTCFQKSEDKFGAI